MTENSLPVLRQQISDLARRMLQREIDPIVGVRLLNRLRAAVPECNDEIFLPIISLESQTEDIPTGDLRENTNAELLKRLHEEMAAFLPKIMPVVDQALIALIARYRE